MRSSHALHASRAALPSTGPQALYKPFTRLPSHLLYDTAVDGPLAIIAAACAEHMKARGA